MKIIGGLKLHPRGFLGSTTEYRQPHVNRPVKVDLIGAVTRSISFDVDDNVLKPNTLIEELFAKSISKEDLIKTNFLFREKILLAALSAFGTLTINQWLEAQKQNPYFDVTQNRFVEEMVCFVYTGHWKYHPALYLDSMMIGTHNSLSYGPCVREWIFANNKEPVLVRDFIQKWLSQRDGFSTLLISLRVLFGT